MSTHNYSIATDTANAQLVPHKLSDEIASSSIVPTLIGVNTDGDTISVIFESGLSAGEITTLDGVIAAHDGVPYPTTDKPQKVEIAKAEPPFAAKKTPEGKSLYGRTHGKEFTLTAGANTLDFDVPYAACKITGMEIVGGEVGDTLDFFILDDDSGTYSTVPNYILNQFGYDVAVAKDFYKRESSYDADLYYNMCISIAYYSQSAKTVYVNYVLHEVKD